MSWDSSDDDDDKYEDVKIWDSKYGWAIQPSHHFTPGAWKERENKAAQLIQNTIRRRQRQKREYINQTRTKKNLQRQQQQQLQQQQQRRHSVKIGRSPRGSTKPARAAGWGTARAKPAAGDLDVDKALDLIEKKAKYKQQIVSDLGEDALKVGSIKLGEDGEYHYMMNGGRKTIKNEDEEGKPENDDEKNVTEHAENTEVQKKEEDVENAKHAEDAE